MKRRIALMLLALACVLALAGCACEHEWVDANCVNPKTCSKCQATEGAPLGHVWAAATCETAKTCETCGETEGEAKGHSMVDATCTEARHCEACSLVEGEALGHTWLDATTEAPKTCEACGKTEGERIVTDERFTTESTKGLYGNWSGIETTTFEEMGLEEGNTTAVGMEIKYGFANDGSFTMSILLADEETFKKDYTAWMVEMTYQGLEAEGMTRDEVDAAMMETMGMNTEDYVKSMVDELNLNDILAGVFSGMGLGGNYYVQGDNLYMGEDWESEMEPYAYVLDGDSLKMKDTQGEEISFTRAAEEKNDK